MNTNFYDIRLYLIIVTTFLMTQLSVRCDVELCGNPVVYSVDRFSNNTVRLFRENDFWDLNGFPDKTKVTKGSMKGYQFFNPVNKSARIVTVLEGSPTIKDRIFKFDGIYWWSWYSHPKFGLRQVSTSAGLYWDQIPKEHGFDAVFHNGDKNDPMLIGLESDPRFSDKYMKIHYFSTKNETLVRKTGNYFNEKDFPKDLTDVFSWTPTAGLKYMVYILKADKYCILTDKQKCTEWKSFSQLFGCTEVPKSDPSGKNKPSDQPKIEEGPEGGPGGESGGESGGGPGGGPGDESGGEGKGETNGGNVPQKRPPIEEKPRKNPPRVEGTNENDTLSTTEGGGTQSIAFSMLSIVLSFFCFAFL